MAIAKQESTNDKKKTTSQTQTVSVGGRDVSTKTSQPKTQTKTQTVSVGGRDVNVQAPKAKYENKTAKATTSGPSVGGRDLSKKQAESSITKPYYDNRKQANTPSTRNDFSSDRDYERYLLDNKVDFTKGDARDYLKQKASESGTTSMDYMQGMRQRYKNQNDTELVRQKIGNGEISQQSAEEINNRYGALLDENGNEVDIDKYNNDVELVTKTAEELNKQIEKLNKDYTSGKIDYETLQAENDRIHKLWEENASMGERLNSYSTVQGFDYYDWAKANGKDVTDFEAYVENFNDTFPERLAQEYASSWWDTLNILPDTYNVLRQIADPNYDASKDVVGSMSEKMRQTSLELRDYAYAGATPASQWSLQCLGSLMPMINSMMIGSLTPLNTEMFTNVALGIQSGAETTRQRLEEGVEPGLALMNGILHGTITGLVEGLNAGAITELITGAPGAYLTKIGLAQFAGPAVIQKYLSTAISEGAEETIETVADWAVDNIQNMIYGSIYGNTLKATELNPGEMVNEFIMASVGTVALGLPGVPGDAKIVIDSKQRYNTAMQAKAHFESVLQSELSIPEEKQIAERCIDYINQAVKPFEESSQIAEAVDIPNKDYVAPTMTFNEMMNNLTNAIQPDVSTELATAQQTLDYAKKLEGDLQQSLLERNVIMPANQYMNMDEKTRHEYLELAKTMEENGRPAIFMDLGDGINGYNSPNGTIINTNQSRTIDVDNLVNMDEKTFQDLMKNDPNQIFEDAGADASAVTSASHEFTHFAEISGQWNALRDYVREQMGAKKFFLLEKRIGDIYKARGINDADVEHEAVAYYVQKNMGSLDFLRRMASYNSSFFNRLTTKAQNFFNDDAQARMETAFMDAFRDAQNKLETAGTPAYSIGSVFQAVNMTVEKSGDMIEAYVNGEKVDEVTFEHVRDSALGNLMRMSVNNGFLTKDQADDQMQMYADMLNTVLRTQDPDLLWAISGSLGYQQVKDGTVIDETKSTKSSAFTSNADKQYNRTFDVTTICNKTQQIINVMSSVMMKLDRGLTEAEIVKVIYDETNKAGEPVPCPVCYVFSRWVGVGGLLDNIKNYQIEYENVDINDLRKRYNALSRQVDEIVKRENIDITSETDEDTDEKTKKKIKGTKAREILDKQLNAEYNALLGRQNTFMLMGKELSEKDKKRLSDLEKDMAIMDRWSWIGKVRLSPNYKPVPHDVLFDMNKGEEFANDYPETWSYRTTRGPAMGKAITPYTSEVLGQTIMGFSGSPSNMKKLGERRSTKNNPLLKPNETKPAVNYFDKAVKNARAQNLIGGSRAQSTSDFRFEYVLDYLLHFMELQAIHSYGQTYTKVPEAVPLLASVGYEVNMSLMAKEFGYREVPKGTKGARELDGKWYVLEFSDKTGMNAEDAFRLASLYDNAQPIMVGINDDHMRLCMADPRITFIIPYHASGANEQRYVDLMRAVGEEVPGKARRDYSKMQNDAEVENPTSQQKRFRKARLDIIMGKATKETRKAVEGNAILENLYDRFYIQGVDPDCFHNFLKKDQAKQIFPYEYWDKTSTIDTADVNGKIFVDYCEALGMVPRFEEFSGEDGYWKMLIDRSMYGLDGNYRDQQAINMDNFNSDFLFKDNKSKAKAFPGNQDVPRLQLQYGIVQPSKVMDASKTEGIVDSSIKRIENGQYSLGEVTDPTTIEFLEDQDHVEVYRAMALIDGKLYPPMATKIKGEDGKYRLQNPSEIGKWYQSEERPDLVDKDGNFKLKKDNGKDVPAAYNPYFHTSLTALNDQFSSAYTRPNLVVVKGEVPSSELTSGYKAEGAKDSVGKTQWHSGHVSGELKKYGKSAREVILSRWFKPVEILSDKTVAKEISKMLEGTPVGIPFNVVTKGVRTELEKLGVPIGDSVGLKEKLGKNDVQYSLGAVMGMANLRQHIEDNPNSKYKDMYDKMLEREKVANDMMFTFDDDGKRVYTNDEIYDKTGWLYDEIDNVFKGEFYDDASINKLVEYVQSQKGIGKKWSYSEVIDKQPTFKDILGEDSLLLVMYPRLEDVHLVVASHAPGSGSSKAGGWWESWQNSIMIAKNVFSGGVARSQNDLKNTIAHEIQHVIQDVEGFEYGDFKLRHDNRPGEKEAIRVGEAQANEKLRKVDNYGNMIADGNNSDAGISEPSDGGDVEVDESEEGIADSGENGELEPGDEVSEGEDTAGENSEPDSEPTVEPEPEEETTPEEEEENLTDNIDDDGEEDEDEPASIKRGGPDFKKTTWKDFIRWVKHRIGDHLDAVEELARKTKNKKIIAKADTAMNFRAIANMAILDGRYELLSKDAKRIGDSLASILDMVPKDLQEDFDYYMYNYRNMDSTSMRERLGMEHLAKKFLDANPGIIQMGDGSKVTPADFAKFIETLESTQTAEQLKKNPTYQKFAEFSKPKYVFGSSKIGYAESKQTVEQMEKEHPEFKAIAEKIWEYGRQDLKVLQEAGIIDQDAYDLFLKETPHYVPIARDIDKAKFEGKYKLDPNKALRRFKGSKIDMWSLEYAMINHTYNVYRSALTNNLHQEIYNTLKPKKNSNASKENVEDIVSDNHAHVEKMKDGTYRMYAYVNGKRRMVKVDENLYNSLTPRKMGMTVPAFATLSELRRNLITSWNPVFYATNAIKDVQDALYNTKYPWRFVPNYIRAWNQIRTNGKYKQMYLRNGGAENSYMHEMSKKDVGFNPLKRIIQVGDAIELAPRLAEFISSIESGNTVEEAMYDSAEVTTNFKRGGELAKTINRNGVTFFNASVQGFNKQIRNWKDAGSKGAVGLLTYMARTALISGIPLYLLNSLAWKDDDDYQELSDYIKENYYIIWKTGNRFIRIPKGRLASFYQTVMTQAETVEDQVTLWNAFMKVIKSGIDNIAPNNPADNFLGSPLIQAFSTPEGKTWYGEELVPSRLQKLPDAEQYDYSTDIISKIVGEKLNVSPYKINYVLDQYSGGIGDVGLPMITLEATNGAESKYLSKILKPIFGEKGEAFADRFVSSLVAPTLDKFTTDPVMKKQCVSTFYELKDTLEKKKNSKYSTDEDVLAYKYLSTVSSEMGELYAKMRDIQSEKNISNSEKYESVRQTKELINAWAQKALLSYDSIDIHGSYAEVGGVKYRVDKQGEWRKMSEQTVKKMSEYNLNKDQTGKFYDNIYSIDSAREEVKANTPAGQNADYREVTVNKIRSSKADAKTKNAMFDSYYSGKFTDAINSMDFDDETKLEIKYAKTLANGEKDKNGKTVSGSKAKAVAKEYERLGVLGDIIDYIKENDIDPSTMGLSKAIVKGYKGSSSKSTSRKKTSSSRSKKASSGGSSGGGGSGIRSAGKLNKLGPVTSKSLIDDKKIANGATNYLKAYQSVFNRSGKKPSTGGSVGSVTCPRCGSTVSSSNGKCPVCGANL